MNNSVRTNEIRKNIISILSTIEDENKLKLIYKKAEELGDMAKLNNTVKEQANFKEAIVEIEEDVSFQDILKEQNYQSISYKEFRELANQIEWEHSLTELLEALD